MACWWQIESIASIATTSGDVVAAHCVLQDQQQLLDSSSDANAFIWYLGEEIKSKLMPLWLVNNTRVRFMLSSESSKLPRANIIR